MFVPRLTNGHYVVYVFSHHTDIYFRQHLFSLIPSPLSPLSLHRGAYDSPLHLELACLSAIRCSSASGAAGGARARQGVLVGCWPLARRCCKGCSPSRLSYSLVAPRVGACPTLLSWPCAGACLTLPSWPHVGALPMQCLRWGTDYATSARVPASSMHRHRPPHRHGAPQR